MKVERNHPMWKAYIAYRIDESKWWEGVPLTPTPFLYFIIHDYNIILIQVLVCLLWLWVSLRVILPLARIYRGWMYYKDGITSGKVNGHLYKYALMGLVKKIYVSGYVAVLRVDKNLHPYKYLVGNNEDE
jgi:hypothetical protein